METALATFGGICLVLSLGLGYLAQTKGVQSGHCGFAGDRIAAAFIGIGLIATAIVVKIDGPTVSLVSTFGVTAALVLLYCLYLLLGRRG